MLDWLMDTCGFKIVMGGVIGCVMGTGWLMDTCGFKIVMGGVIGCVMGTG